VAVAVVPHERAEEPAGDAEVEPGGTDDEGAGLDLPARPGAPDVASEQRPDPDPLPWPDADGWVARLLASPLARAGTDAPSELLEPLVARGDSVYLDRYWRDEGAVADDLLARASVQRTVDDVERAALDRYFGDDVDDRQRRAAVAALEHQLAVVAGGPGTGKTHTVARLLAVLASAGGDGPPPEVALAAPTGKAAARLTEAITQAVLDAGPPPEVAERLRSLEARTVHRLLGYRGDGSFRRDRTDPLTADVVVVDEVSMVSLPLMARLLEAIGPDARVVLVGDPHQLASVEAGAVLGDIVGTGADGTPSGVAGNVVRLQRVHRFAEGSAIAEMARAVNAGDADTVVQLLRHGAAGTGGAVQWLAPEDSAGTTALLDRVVAHAEHLVDLARAGDDTAALDHVGRLKVLCATRRGRWGVQDWNQLVEQRLRDTGRMRSRWSAGRPVMVAANDYLNGVFNGDVGVVVRATDAQGGRRRLHVAFDAPEVPRRLDPSRLADVETQWAMTIHKSQGSEFDHVVVALPPAPSPILTRELLYTAVTRARRSVMLVASEDAVRAAVERPIARSSGLAGRLSRPV